MNVLEAADLQPCSSYSLYLLMVAGGWKVNVRRNQPPAVYIGGDFSCHSKGRRGGEDDVLRSMRH